MDQISPIKLNRSNLAYQANPMKSRSRSFDGCWTCRSRKIKCDGRKPKCSRCEKGNFDCKGYNIVLAWADTLSIDGHNRMAVVHQGKQKYGPNESRFLRRSVDSMQFPELCMFDSFDKLNAVTSRFDDVTPYLVNGAYTYGPFGVFTLPWVGALDPGNISRANRNLVFSTSINTTTSVSSIVSDAPSLLTQPEGRINGLVNVSSLNGRVNGSNGSGSINGGDKNGSINGSLDGNFPPKIEPRQEILAEPSPGYKEHPQNVSELQTPLENPPEPAIFSKSDNSYVHYKLLDASKLTILAIKGPRIRFSEQQMFHILYPKFFPNDESDFWTPDISVLSKFFYVDNARKLVLSSLISQALDSINALNLTFIRVVHPNCCWNNLVVPFTKQIFFELLCEDYISSGSWDSHLIDPETSPPRNLLLKNIKLTVLFIVLSNSCFQKAQKVPKPKNVAPDSYPVNEDLKVSIELRKFAVNLLNYHLDEYNENSQTSTPYDGYDTLLLLALVLQINLDSLFGVFENFDLIYAIGDFILKNVKTNKTHITQIERYLRQLFHLFSIFYSSTQAINVFNYSISEKDRELKYLDIKDTYDLSSRTYSDEAAESDENSDDNIIGVSTEAEKYNPLSFTVHFNKVQQTSTAPGRQIAKKKPSEGHAKGNRLVSEPNMVEPNPFVTFGLPRTFFDLFYEVIQLANHKNVFRTKGLTPRNFPKICAEVEDQVLNWSIEKAWKLFDNEYNPISNVAKKCFLSKFHEGLYYHGVCFQNALIVYFRRLISGVPISSYQKQVRASIEAMEKLSEIARDLDGEDVQFTPSFWPLLVCGCDIDIAQNPDLRERCERLWQEKFFSSYNYWRSKQILFEVWNRRSEEAEDHGFMDLIREWDTVLSL